MEYRVQDAECRVDQSFCAHQFGEFVEPMILLAPKLADTGRGGKENLAVTVIYVPCSLGSGLDGCNS